MTIPDTKKSSSSTRWVSFLRKRYIFGFSFFLWIIYMYILTNGPKSKQPKSSSSSSSSSSASTSPFSSFSSSVLLFANSFRSSSSSSRNPSSTIARTVSPKVPSFFDGSLDPINGTQLPFVLPKSLQHLRHHDNYDTWLFTDSFLKNDSIYIISMIYAHNWPHQVHKGIKISIPLLRLWNITFTKFYVRDEYESSIIGIYTNPLLSKVSSVEVQYTYETYYKEYTLHQIPQDRSSQYAMCALFYTDQHLFEMWTSYWWLLGIDTFYMYYNGPSNDLYQLIERSKNFKGTFIFFHWPFDYWVANTNRPHSGQPMMVNDCYYRHRNRHEFMAMYDLDEILVFPSHTDLRSFHQSITVPWTALRSKSSWTKIELDKLNTPYNQLTIDSLLAQPLTRTDIDYRREKYIVNTSYGVDNGITIVNVHGVYQVNTGIGPLKEGGPTQTLMDEKQAYHFHFVNVGRDRSREKFIEHPTTDARAQELTKINIEKRGRPERDSYLAQIKKTKVS